MDGKDPRGTQNGIGGSACANALLARPFAVAVGICGGCGTIRLPSGLAVASKNVFGGDVLQGKVQRSTGNSHFRRSRAINGGGQRLFLLGPINRSISCGIDHRARAVCLDGGRTGAGLRQVATKHMHRRQMQ